MSVMHIYFFHINVAARKNFSSIGFQIALMAWRISQCDNCLDTSLQVNMESLPNWEEKQMFKQ